MLCPNELAPHVDRDWPADLRLLLGAGSTGVLDAIVREAGGSLISSVPRQVNHQPGRSTTVQYRVAARWPDGRESVETVVARTGERLPGGAVVLERAGTRVAAWRWRDDPALPGLAAALDPVRVTALLDDLGVRSDGDPRATLVTRAYRPGRRAVVQATIGDRSVYLKAVRPHVVEHLHRTHRRLASELPSPDSLGWSDEGILAMPGMPGTTLRAVLRACGVAPPVGEIEAVLDRIPTGLGDVVRTAHPAVAARHHAETIVATMPSLRERIERTMADLESLANGPTTNPGHPIVGVHGDLYEAQLLVQHGRTGDAHVSAILDLDTARAGHRIDDLANFCAHLSVLALTTGRAPATTIKRYGAAVLDVAERRFDRADVRARIAAFVVGLATGPFRVLEPNWQVSTEDRLDLADHWLEGARRGRRPR